MIRDNEQVYDERISPLMAQIIAICKEHEIPCVATFEYAPGGLCTYVVPQEGQCDRLAPAASMILHGFTAYTVTRRPTPDTGSDDDA